MQVPHSRSVAIVCRDSCVQVIQEQWLALRANAVIKASLPTQKLELIFVGFAQVSINNLYYYAIVRPIGATTIIL